MLLSLDPEDDPLAIVLAIDFYALRAREYAWFVQFCEAWENKRNLSQLPNVAYSLALASFHLGTGDLADELLQNALTMFPSFLVPLLDKCGVQTDSRVGIKNPILLADSYVLNFLPGNWLRLFQQSR